MGELGLVEAYGRQELTCRQSKEQDTIALLRQQLAHFPPQKLPTIDECKAFLAKRLALMDKQMQSLSVMKSQLMHAQRELQLMERNFLQQCSEKIRINFPLN
jgi:uncharacterized membrane protein YheB (UPF0754 family)